MTPVVEVEAATVVRGRRPVWTDMSVQVGPGECVAVLGPNGVGKSTLLKAILGLVPVAAGNVSLLGQPPRRANARATSSFSAEVMEAPGACSPSRRLVSNILT